MTKKILIDTSHVEEKRVAIINEDNRLEEFEFETNIRQTLKGNIYLAKVTRVEPSLQAAFIDYGGNRHGFLAFSEIHPDYYQIPIADKEALENELAEAQKKRASELEEEFIEEEKGKKPAKKTTKKTKTVAAKKETGEVEIEAEGIVSIDPEDMELEIQTFGGTASDDDGDDDETAEVVAESTRLDITKRYKIQEVMKRNQIILVQIVKEERGNKGAALTTYLSLAGRYSVLMPNTANAGGISRKINNSKDRKRLREILNSVDVDEKQSLIIRTAGQERTKIEVKRDHEYLSRTWDKIREKTLSSIAPECVHEEGDLIRRTIRDLYTKDVEEVWVEGEEGYKNAKAFMKSLMPSHVKKVLEHKDETASLFRKFEIEKQIEELQGTTANLPSGGSLVINPTEALVAIDINSGKSTKERGIDETAYNTNMEAAVEIARQLKLRDLAGLIVIDFIDMEVSKHIVAVEKKLREALKPDRARIQTGRISQFGLLELSRQRLRPSIFESLTQDCKTCGGTGYVRSTESTTLAIFRAIEAEGLSGRTKELELYVPAEVALYLFNKKRIDIEEMEKRFKLKINLHHDATLTADSFNLRSLRTRRPQPQRNQGKGRRQPENKGTQNKPDQQSPQQREGTQENVDGRDKRRRRPRRGRRPQDNVQEGSQNPAQQENTGAQNKPAEATSSQEGDKKRSRNRRRRPGNRRPRPEGSSTTDSKAAATSSSSDSGGSAPKITNITPAPSTGGSNQPPKKGWWKKLLK